MLEYKCMYAVTIYFFTFPISKELYICKKLAADDDAYLAWSWLEIWL